jgi:cytochrome c-type biogenesis protein
MPSSLPLPIAAFFAGLVSFLSPCVLPLVPGYVSLISGASVEELQNKDGRLLRKVLLQSVMFILGFTVVFVSLGAVASGFGQLINTYKKFLSIIGGAIVILFGLHLTGIFKIKWLYADTRLHQLKGGKGPLGAFVVGFAFAFGWSPCVGPILTPIMALAATEKTFTKGVLLLFIYSMGLAVPFLLTSLGIDRFLRFYSRFRRHLHTVEVVSGVFLIAIGLLLVTGRFTWLATQLGFLNRFSTVDIFAIKNVAYVLLGIAAIAVVFFAIKFLRRAPKTDQVSATADKATPGIFTLRNAVYILITVVAISILLFAGKYMSNGPKAGRLSAGNAAGQIAPEFELQILGGNGKTMKLSELKGKAVLVNFWATYCEPCKAEMPWIAELQKQYGPQGFQVVGIDMDPEVGDQAISNFAKRMGVNYPILLGTPNAMELYGGDRGLPVNFFIDRSGKVVHSELGGLSKNELEQNIKESLGETAKTASAR